MGPAEQSTPRPASTPARSARTSPPGAHHPARWPARPAAPPTATPPSARTTTGTPPGRRHPAPAPNAAMRYPGRSRSRRRGTACPSAPRQPPLVCITGPSAPAAQQAAASSQAAVPGRKSPATAQACDAPEADGPREDAAQQPIVLVDNGGNDWTFPLFSTPTSEAGCPTAQPRLSRAGEELATTQADIAERAGGWRDWLYLFATWREHAIAELKAVYETEDEPRAFDAVTQTVDHSSPQYTFPYSRAVLTTGLWTLRSLVERLPLAVEPEALQARSENDQTPREHGASPGGRKVFVVHRESRRVFSLILTLLPVRPVLCVPCCASRAVSSSRDALTSAAASRARRGAGASPPATARTPDWRRRPASSRSSRRSAGSALGRVRLRGPASWPRASPGGCGSLQWTVPRGSDDDLRQDRGAGEPGLLSCRWRSRTRTARSPLSGHIRNPYVWPCLWRKAVLRAHRAPPLQDVTDGRPGQWARSDPRL